MWGFLIGGFFLSRTYVELFYMLAAMIGGLVIIAWKSGIEVKLPPVNKVLLYTAVAECASVVIIYMIVRAGNLI